MKSPQTDFDSPWKEILETYFPEFLAFFFPDVYGGIDWQKRYEFLDKELQKVVRDARLGRRTSDKLVKVWRITGEEEWILVHVEVQSFHEIGFAKRMYIYHYRIFDRYDKQVISLAVLGDASTSWRPNQFGYSLWGCEIKFKFPQVKLVDYRAQWADLEASQNPFAIVVMAHLKALESQHDAGDRRIWKVTLMRKLLAKGYERQQILNLLRFIDWIMTLPEEVEREIWDEIYQQEEAAHMTYITSLERLAIKKGLEQGLQEGRQEGLQIGREQGERDGILSGIEIGLELRFGQDGLGLLPEVYKIEDIALLRVLQRALRTVTSLDAWRQLYLPSTAPPPA